MNREEILKKLMDAVINGDRDAAVALSKEALNAGIDAYEALSEGCIKAMAVMSERYDKGEAFVPDILVSSDAMNGAIEVLKPHIKVDTTKVPGTIILGVVEGDIHDIGKNIVKIVLEASGFRVIDLGRNVPLKKFVEVVREKKPDILGLSALMTTSMLAIPETIEMLKDAGLRESVKVLVGGAPLSAAWAESIGADGYAQNAPKAVRVAEDLVRTHRGVT